MLNECEVKKTHIRWEPYYYLLLIAINCYNKNDNEDKRTMLIIMWQELELETVHLWFIVISIAINIYVALHIFTVHYFVYDVNHNIAPNVVRICMNTCTRPM